MNMILIYGGTEGSSDPSTWDALRSRGVSFLLLPLSLSLSPPHLFSLHFLHLSLYISL